MLTTIWTRLFVVLFLTTGMALHADDKPVAPEGYRVQPLQGGAYVLVKKEVDPLAHVSQSGTPGKYDPANLFSGTNPMANKSFSAASATSANDAAFKSGNQANDLAKPYLGAGASTDHTTSNFNKKASVASTGSYSRNSDFSKSFATAKADVGPGASTKFPTALSTEQNHTAILGSQNTTTFASSMNGKTYEGPEAEAVKRDMNRINAGMMQVKDLPNRSLTIDEVRALINHGFKPNTDERPEAASKPLNDPDYKPEASPEPPPVIIEEDPSGAVPSPGMMAQPPPENTEPLPQQH